MDQNSVDGKKENVIEIPVHIINQVIKVYKESEKLHEELDREPSDDEIAKND